MTPLIALGLVLAALLVLAGLVSLIGGVLRRRGTALGMDHPAVREYLHQSEALAALPMTDPDQHMANRAVTAAWFAIPVTIRDACRKELNAADRAAWQRGRRVRL